MILEIQLDNEYFNLKSAIPYHVIGYYLSKQKHYLKRRAIAYSRINNFCHKAYKYKINARKEGSSTLTVRY